MKLLIGTVAFLLLSLPAQAAEPQADGADLWRGAYGGLHIGIIHLDGAAKLSGDPAIGQRLIGLFDRVPASLSPDGSRLSGGVHFGYNIPVAQFLFGIEADITLASGKISGSVSRVGAVNNQTTLDLNANWLGSARGRAGYFVGRHLLVFIAGGLAFGSFEQTLKFTTSGNSNLLGTDPQGNIFTLFCKANEACISGKSDQILVGWTIGTGFEYAFSETVVFRGEYAYTDFGRSALKTTALETGNPPPDVFLKADAHIRLHQFRSGLTFMF